ncbi:MAG: polysaccharide biosynthesis/export family protein [Calditrichia bacterium]
MKCWRYLPFIVLIIFLTQSIYSQDTQYQAPVPYSDRPAQYILGSNDVLLITVNLWGHVQRPGIYSIPSAFGIIDLLSSAGGPLGTARLNDVRIVRKNQEVITVNVEEFIKTGNKDLLLPLQPGDIVIVSGSIASIFASVVRVMADIALILNVIVLANRL